MYVLWLFVLLLAKYKNALQRCVCVFFVDESCSVFFVLLDNCGLQGACGWGVRLLHAFVLVLGVVSVVE